MGSAIIDGAGADITVKFAGAAYIHLEGLDITGGGYHGVFFSDGAHHIRVAGSRIYDNYAARPLDLDGDGQPGGNGLAVLGFAGMFYKAADARQFASVAAKVEKARAVSVLPDSKSNVWLGSWYGVFRSNESGLTNFFPKGVIAGQVNALFEDARGGLWIADQARLRRWDGIRLESQVLGTGGAAAEVRCLAEDKAGRIYAGTRASGLWCRQTNQFYRVPTPRLHRWNRWSCPESPSQTGTVTCHSTVGAPVHLQHDGDHPDSTRTKP